MWSACCRSISIAWSALFTCRLISCADVPGLSSSYTWRAFGGGRGPTHWDPVIHVARACPRSASTTSAGKPSAGTRESSCSGDIESGCSGTLGIRLRFQHYPHIGVADAPRSPPADRGPLADLSFDPSGSRYPFVDGEHPEKIEYPGATLQEGTRSRQPANISTQHTAQPPSSQDHIHYSPSCRCVHIYWPGLTMLDGPPPSGPAPRARKPARFSAALCLLLRGSQ